MAKKAAKNLVYFILYIVLITELLIVILERDELEEKEHKVRDKMIGTIADHMVQPLILTVPVRSDRDAGSKEPTIIKLTPIGLVEDEVKVVKFFIDVAPGTRTPPGWPAGGISVDKSTQEYSVSRDPNGNGDFAVLLNSPGEYKFTCYASVERTIPSYLPDHLKEALIEEVNHKKGLKDQKELNIQSKSETKTFILNVTTKGVQRVEGTRG